MIPVFEADIFFPYEFSFIQSVDFYFYSLLVGFLLCVGS